MLKLCGLTRHWNIRCFFLTLWLSLCGGHYRILFLFRCDRSTLRAASLLFCGRSLVSAILPSGQRTLSPCYRPLVFTQFYTLALASWTVLSGRRPLSLGDRPLIPAAVSSGRRPCSLHDRPLVFVAVPSGRRFPLNSTDAAVRRPHPV